MHQYYLDSIDFVHAPAIQYYQSVLETALRNRDARAVLDAQSGLQAVHAQVDAEKAAENKRYNAEKASIKASCK